jgi:hypothetical protein
MARTSINVVVPDCPPSVTPINRATPIKTGQTTSYRTNDNGDLQRGRGQDFYNLDVGDDNFFGNTKRFTGTTGGYYDEVTDEYKDISGTVVTKSIAFPNDVIIDWQSFNQLTGDVIWWSLDTTLAITWNNAIDGQPYTRASYNDWYMPNTREMLNICNFEFDGLINYSPFNINNSTSPNWVWVSTTRSSDSSQALLVTNIGVIGGNTKTLARQMILLRIGNTSEL